VPLLSRRSIQGGNLSFYTELRRRNVFKVAIVYTAVAWLLLQVSDTLGPALRLPEWFVSAVAFLVILGFPVAIVFAWAFDLTPDGLKRETKADSDVPEDARADSRLNLIVVAALVLALGYFVIDKYVLDSGPDTAEPTAASEIIQQQPVAAEAAESDNSIAVLPFVNMSSDAEQEYFSDGLSEELLNLLARIPQLKVAARTSSFSFKGKDVAIPEIASQLKVAHILEGSVRKHGDQIRVTAQLIRADNGYHLWSETYDRQLDNVFQIQEDIAVAVVDALRITLLGEAPRARKTDPEAYQLFLEGQYLKRQITSESLNAAVEAFRKAVEIDPSYAPAWAELADTYLWGGGHDRYSDAERDALADEAIQMAISNDPDYAFAYYVRGVLWFFSAGDFRQGIEDFERALELDPDDAFIVAAIGKGAFLSGNFELAIRQYQAALAMEPVVPEFYWFLGRTYLSSGRLEEAEATFRKLASLSSSYHGEFHLFETLFLKGDYEAALEVVDTPFTRAVTHHALGNTVLADEALAEVIENSFAYQQAMAHGYRREVDRAFELLDQIVTSAEFYPTFLLVETAFQSLHADPRWDALLEQLGLLEFWLEMERD
jgi:TolB-like protein/Flp pilus assembly protein TadD